MSEQEWFGKDFYKTLGVAKDADDVTIKKAYRKLARTWHPDQNPGDEKAEAKFKEIGEAYSVLSNKEQRQRYDAIRQMAGGGARFSAGSGAGGPDLSDLFGGAFSGGNVRFSTNGAGGTGFEDILGGLFGGGGGAGFGGGFGGGPGFGAPRASKGADRKASMTISLRESLDGAMLSVGVDGKSLKVRVPAGVKNGQKIRLKGKGQPGTNGGPAGDLEVTINVSAHPVFLRDGDNLRVTVPVTFAEAALGTKVQVPLMDGNTVTVKVPAGTQSGSTLRVRGKGVQTSKKPGDLLVDIQVRVPDKLSREQKKAMEELAKSFEGFNPRDGLVEQAKA
ncbi:DnaJ C-terminal domain-containing protein [Schaalia vaccimaxillae]|uniref:DnaJ C-terminal domain-containing protein n=1 Tax=Schaalia vaccimaxillae TaxID=183916 RepID=UPI0003B635F8|nr:DnaJ C-terminal domain-containing protein [Schaalia vaccimaxillae]